MSHAHIICSNCGHSKEVPSAALPQQRVNATYPKCKHVFVFDPAMATRQETPLIAGPQQPPPKPEKFFMLSSLPQPDPGGNARTDSASVSTVEVRNDLLPELKALSSAEGKYNSLTLLIVTVILFFSAQIVSAKWQDVAILMTVLLIHEMGHLLSMKLLRYNDVKMFFIPFLGAAVSGRNQNETAVKSCMVSLMGPFPGIILGVLLYLLFALTKNYYVFKTAQVMLLLNAFNFLPIMPLDGGRYIDVLFVNRRHFRFFFAFLGAAIFLLLAVSSKDPVIGLVGVFSVYVALSNLTLHAISHDLKAKGITAASVNELLEDESSLQIVINRLQAKFPRHFHPKLAYRAIFNHLQVIVATIKFKPAGFWSKCALLSVYVVFLTASILVSFTFLAANYKEKSRTEELNGNKTVIVERHIFGRKTSECPVDSALNFNGKGTAYSFNGAVSNIYYYANGFRAGEWQTLDDAGKVIEKKIYDKGYLLSVAKLENGSWKTYPAGDMPLMKRCSEEIQRLSQPFKSNHLYF
jgi:Zn-dependent protease